MRIAICGSMSFAKEMLEVSRLLEAMGHKPILPIDTIESVRDPSRRQNIYLLIEKDIIRDHLGKIRESDAILVLNYEKNGIAGYVGGSVLIEMGFAHYLNKQIYLLNPIPRMSYSVEIEAMQPVVLNGDLKKLREYA
jgi:hypothetical protein